MLQSGDLADREVNELSQGHAAGKRRCAQEPNLLTTLWTAHGPQPPGTTDDLKHIQRREARLERDKTSDQLDRKGKAFPH